jgi:hypothetical protein
VIILRIFFQQFQRNFKLSPFRLQSRRLHHLRQRRHQRRL